jgi:hypothetical protein
MAEAQRKPMSTESSEDNTATILDALRVDDAEAIEVGPGCYRRDLPSTSGVRVWVVDISAGSEWPYIDEHNSTGEEIYVVSGELIEGDSRFEAGTYIFFKPGSSHRPRSEKGVRLFGFNLAAEPTRND